MPNECTTNAQSKHEECATKKRLKIGEPLSLLCVRALWLLLSDHLPYRLVRMEQVGIPAGVMWSIYLGLIDRPYFCFFCGLGKNAAMIPKRGSSVLMWKMYSMLVLSASQPKKAELMPAMPYISPKKSPDIIPTLVG